MDVCHFSSSPATGATLAPKRYSSHSPNIVHGRSALSRVQSPLRYYIIIVIGSHNTIIVPKNNVYQTITPSTCHVTPSVNCTTEHKIIHVIIIIIHSSSLGEKIRRFLWSSSAKASNMSFHADLEYRLYGAGSTYNCNYFLVLYSTRSTVPITISLATWIIFKHLPPFEMLQRLPLLVS